MPTQLDTTSNGWGEWRNHVLLELKCLREKVDELLENQFSPRDCHIHRAELDTLKKLVDGRQRGIEELKRFRWQVIGAMIALQSALTLSSHYQLTQ